MLISIKLNFNKCYTLTIFSRNEEEIGVTFRVMDCTLQMHLTYRPFSVAGKTISIFYDSTSAKMFFLGTLLLGLNASKGNLFHPVLFHIKFIPVFTF